MLLVFLEFLGHQSLISAMTLLRTRRFLICLNSFDHECISPMILELENFLRPFRNL